MERPTGPGWYWWRPNPFLAWAMTHAAGGGPGDYARPEGRASATIAALGGEWSGPLEPPGLPPELEAPAGPWSDPTRPTPLADLSAMLEAVGPHFAPDLFPRGRPIAGRVERVVADAREPPTATVLLDSVAAARRFAAAALYRRVAFVLLPPDRRPEEPTADAAAR